MYAACLSGKRKSTGPKFFTRRDFMTRPILSKTSKSLPGVRPSNILMKTWSWPILLKNQRHNHFHNPDAFLQQVVAVLQCFPILVEYLSWKFTEHQQRFFSP